MINAFFHFFQVIWKLLLFWLPLNTHSTFLTIRRMFVGVQLRPTQRHSPHTQRQTALLPVQLFCLQRTCCHVLGVSGVLKYIVLQGILPWPIIGFRRPAVARCSVLRFSQWLLDIFSFKAELLPVFFLHNLDDGSSCASINSFLIHRSRAQPMSIRPLNPPECSSEVSA